MNEDQEEEYDRKLKETGSPMIACSAARFLEDGFEGLSGDFDGYADGTIHGLYSAHPTMEGLGPITIECGEEGEDGDDGEGGDINS